MYFTTYLQIDHQQLFTIFTQIFYKMKFDLLMLNSHAVVIKSLCSHALMARDGLTKKKYLTSTQHRISRGRRGLSGV